MEQLLEIMSEVRPDVDFVNETKLIDDDILTSFDIISIVGEINAQFQVEISVNDFTPENFNSAQALYALIQKL